MRSAASGANGNAASRTVVLAGATGLVGKEILLGLLADNSVTSVHSLGRRPLDVQHPKLISHVVDFKALPRLQAIDETYLALGTTIKIAGSQAAFRSVDFDANLAVARATLATGCRRLGVVSAMGANAQSTVFYNRVKGELEQALATLDFEALVIARPSLLTGDRNVLGQPSRSGETIGKYVSALLRPLIPSNFRAIAAIDVARALLERVPVAQGREVLLSGSMQSKGSHAGEELR
ncbi:nucleoside-diphosphate sugar epimerase [Noviherbaspirillum sp. Root189]|nr:nucleoside-diphosphate sugar epimerase [Noviherbaspirillum sp. Root189]